MSRNALKELEEWTGGHKSRYVSGLGIDDGYGATCWSLTLGSGKLKPEDDWAGDMAKKSAEIYAAETNFISYGNRAIPPNVVYVVDGDSDDDWPGLEATILAAIDKANELGL